MYQYTPSGHKHSLCSSESSATDEYYLSEEQTQLPTHAEIHFTVSSLPHPETIFTIYEPFSKCFHVLLAGHDSCSISHYRGSGRTPLFSPFPHPQLRCLFLHSPFRSRKHCASSLPFRCPRLKKISGHYRTPSSSLASFPSGPRTPSNAPLQSKIYSHAFISLPCLAYIIPRFSISIIIVPLVQRLVSSIFRPTLTLHDTISGAIHPR